jgi:hypothetical protein
MVSFVINAAPIVKTIKAEAVVLAKSAEQIRAAVNATNVTIQRDLVDSMTIAYGTLSGVTKAQFWGKPSGEVRKAVKAVIAQGEALGAWQADMSETLVHCVGVAFLANVPFQRNLKATHKADGAERQPKREAADGADTSGAVTKTTPEAAEKTARKLIGQLRTLGNDAVAAAVVDVMLEFNPKFTETEPAKA